MTNLTLSPASPVFFQNPYVAYRSWHEDSRVFFWENYGWWCLAGFDEVFAAFRDKRFGREVLHVASREELGWDEPPEHTKLFWDFDAASLLNREPPVHTRLRSLVSRAFVGRNVERLRPFIGSLAHGLIDRFERGTPVDLIEAFATPIPVLVITHMLGVPAEDASQLLDWSHQMVAMYQFGRTREVEDCAREATIAFQDYIRRVIAERRRQPGDDLLSVLIAARDEGDRLSDEELETTAILLLNAGHEATVHAIGNSIKTLLEQGTDPRAAFADADATERTVEECLRFDPPLHLFTRYALTDFQFAGLDLKKGQTVGLLLGAANRDPRRWSDPDRFDPTRPVQTNVAFGGGIHFCVGAPLARLEMAVALPALFERLPGLRLAAPPSYRDAYHFHGLERLLVEF